MSAKDYIFDATQANYKELVIENSHKGPVLVNYWAPWAGPCLKLYPELETLVSEFNGSFILVNVNTEGQKELAKENQVNSLPTVKIYLNAEIVETVHGAFSVAEYRNLITALLPTETDDLIARALQQFGAGEREAEVNALIVHLELHQAANEISSMEQITEAIESNPEDCLPLLQYAAISLFNDVMKHHWIIS